MRILILLAILCYDMNAMARTLTDYQWKNRLLVAFIQDDAALETEFTKQIDTLACELKNRDLIVFVVSGEVARSLNQGSESLDEQSFATLKSRREFPDASFEMLLIGKDGGIKASSADATQLPDFLSLIDTMPMRRAEIAQQASDC